MVHKVPNLWIKNYLKCIFKAQKISDHKYGGNLPKLVPSSPLTFMGQKSANLVSSLEEFNIQ